MGIDCLGRTKKTNIYFIIFILSNLLIGMGSRYDINYEQGTTRHKLLNRIIFIATYELDHWIKRYFILKLWFLLKGWNWSLIRNQSENINVIVSHFSRVKCDRRYPNSHLLWDVWKLNCNMCRIIFKRLIINKDCGVVCRTFISDTATRCSCCFTNKRVSISLHTILLCISRPFYLSHRNHNLKMKNFLIQ